jgi:hypothetical protein
VSSAEEALIRWIILFFFVSLLIKVIEDCRKEMLVLCYCTCFAFLDHALSRSHTAYLLRIGCFAIYFRKPLKAELVVWLRYQEGLCCVGGQPNVFFGKGLNPNRDGEGIHPTSVWITQACTRVRKDSQSHYSHKNSRQA